MEGFEAEFRGVCGTLAEETLEGEEVGEGGGGAPAEGEGGEGTEEDGGGVVVCGCGFGGKVDEGEGVESAERGEGCGRRAVEMWEGDE